MKGNKEGIVIRAVGQKGVITRAVGQKGVVIRGRGAGGQQNTGGKQVTAPIRVSHHCRFL